MVSPDAASSGTTSEPGRVGRKRRRRLTCVALAVAIAAAALLVPGSPAAARDDLPNVTVTCSGSHAVRCTAKVTGIPEGWATLTGSETRPHDLNAEMYWSVINGTTDQTQQRDLLDFDVDLLMTEDDIFGEGGDPWVRGFEVKWTGICHCGRSPASYQGFFQVKFEGAPDPIKIYSGRSRLIDCLMAP